MQAVHTQYWKSRQWCLLTDYCPCWWSSPYSWPWPYQKLHHQLCGWPLLKKSAKKNLLVEPFRSTGCPSLVSTLSASPTPLGCFCLEFTNWTLLEVVWFCSGKLRMLSWVEMSHVWGRRKHVQLCVPTICASSYSLGHVTSPFNTWVLYTAKVAICLCRISTKEFLTTQLISASRYDLTVVMFIVYAVSGPLT